MDTIEVFRKLREDRNVSQTQVAHALNIARSTYADIENKKIRLTSEDFAKLCVFFDVQASSIVRPEKKVIEITEDEIALLKEAAKLLAKFAERAEIHQTTNLSKNGNRVNITAIDNKEKK